MRHQLAAAVAEEATANYQKIRATRTQGLWQVLGVGYWVSLFSFASRLYSSMALDDDDEDVVLYIMLQR